MVLALVAAPTVYYMGAWADVFGRKRLMYVFVSITLVSNIMLALNAVFILWPKEYIVLCSVPQALAAPVWTLSIYSFIADISEPDQRAFRMGMITIARLLGPPLALPVGETIFKAGNRLRLNGKYQVINTNFNSFLV